VLVSDVNLSATAYRIVVGLTAKRLTVYRSGYPILSFPAGIGTPATPTVTGNYFVAVRESHVPAAYGPFVLDTSAHSDAIKSWEGMGDAIVAIHGPIDAYADARIGTTGARISNGCIRLHDSDLAQLTIIPVGTPVDIVA
jgi:lipoprotein-anchoring transpeptidase ErfK/SrfK